MARPGLTRHRKFLRLARAIGGPIIARGVLELLWDSCYESGEEYVGTGDDIESQVGWTGERGVCARALADAGAPEGFGFIEPLESGDGQPVRYRIHDLWHHAPDYVAKRHKRELQRHQKEKPSIDRHAAPNGRQRSSSLDWQDGVDLPPAPAPAPAPARKSVSPATLRDAAPAAVLTFPVVGKDGPFWALTQRHLDEWRELFPGLDIMAEARKALAWIGANDGRRKTAGGMKRFLVGWFTRTVDRGGVGGPVHVNHKTAGNLGAAQRFVDRGGVR